MKTKHPEETVLAGKLMREAEEYRNQLSGLGMALAHVNKDPLYTMQWSSKAFEFAARVNVWEQVLKSTGDLPFVVNWIRAKVTNMARNPKHSTDPIMNFCHECELKAWADVLEQLEAVV